MKLLCIALLFSFITITSQATWFNTQSQFSAFARPFIFGQSCGSTTGAELACYSGIGADGGATTTVFTFDYLSNAKVLSLPDPVFNITPISRVQSTGVISADRYLVVYGGYKGDSVVPPPRTLTYDFTNSVIIVKNETLVTANGSVSDHFNFGAYGPSSAVSSNGDMFIYGGSAVIINLDFITRFVVTASQFISITPDENGQSPPSPRFGSSVGIYEGGGSRFFWVFGGAAGQGSPNTFTPTYMNDVGKFDIIASAWVTPSTSGTAPSARTASAYITLKTNVMIIFGGRNSVGVLNDVYSFNLATGAWVSFPVSGTPPSARDRTGFFHLNWPSEDSLLILGGATVDATPLDDFWYLQITSNGSSPIQAPIDIVSPTSSLYVLPSLSNSHVVVVNGTTLSPSPVPPMILTDSSSSFLVSWMSVLL